MVSPWVAKRAIGWCIGGTDAHHGALVVVRMLRMHTLFSEPAGHVPHIAASVGRELAPRDVAVEAAVGPIHHAGDEALVALHLHTHLTSQLGNVGSSHDLCRHGLRLTNVVAAHEDGCHAALDGEVHVLRNIACRREHNLGCVQLC